MHEIIFSFGSNLGNREKLINDSIAQLQQQLNLQNIKKSSIIETDAILKSNSPKNWDKPYLNMVLKAKINLYDFPPTKILEIIKEIEVKLGRKPTNDIWAPREIDIDILTIDQITCNFVELKIPHPQLPKRSFFLDLIDEIKN